jgi:dUTP pyrophosphatase
MTLIEKTLKLLNLKVNERFNIKGCMDQDDQYIDYCIDYRGHLLYETKIEGKYRWVNSRLHTFLELLNGTCDIIYKEVKMKEYPILKFKKLSKDAYTPTRGTPGSSGLDVYTPRDADIPARGDALIALDLAFDIPFGWDLAVYNKSGIATKKKLSKGAELIDSDYTGNAHIHFFNNSDTPVHFNKGDKISQLVMREVWMGELEEVDEIEKDTDRGAGAFGSTGTKAEVK